MTAELPVPGDRIELLRMVDDPCPIEPGTTGTVRAINDTLLGTTQISVTWDTPRTLALVVPPDEFRIIERVMD